MPMDSTEGRPLIVAIEDALTKASTMRTLIDQSHNDMRNCARDLARVAAETVLAWLKQTEKEAIAMMPRSGGGDTGAMARQGIDAIEMLGLKDAR